MTFPRWFEVEMKNLQIAILSEPEIEKYRVHIREVRTQLSDDELSSIAPKVITRADRRFLGIEK